MEPLKALVVDDTIVYRKIVGDVLSTIPGVDVVGTANNGKIAMSKIKTLNPDIITLDIEMPEMNGLDVLERLNSEYPDIKTIMVSTLTREGGEMTIKALELGAFDFIPKPLEGTMKENTEKIHEALVPIVKVLKRKFEIQSILKGGKKAPKRPLVKKKPSILKSQTNDIINRMKKLGRRSASQKSEIITIGISTGGPNALAKMMPEIPADIGVPILIVQHMPPIFTQSLAKSLDTKCSISVKEASDGDIVEPNVALIAPGGKQMKIVAGSDGLTRRVKITDDPPENSCKPSVDYLFRSVASHYVGRTTGVIMTGMGSDGTKGLTNIKENGGVVIAQDEFTCTVFGMPKEPIESKIADIVAPLDKIAFEITKTVKK
ncbi:MAG: chemotaxis response regulator protein-glutamate methylesterase [Desulfobacterales bacterium]|nr:chemotaxis response regulator protein-glutamate methylesterase [Desulfobacterales bacterium]MCP4158465.1 chemotaxis response regulator protein-glutamate methylesterase [Deltaproteobacteria bacterium]